MNIKALVLIALLVECGNSPLQAQVVPLQKLQLKVEETSVSGLSAGGYMAVQFHIANSAMVKGAGVIAGGPYFCAKDDQNTATSICSCTGFGSCKPAQAVQLVPGLVQITDQNAQQGATDATSHLSNSRVWLFSGSLDSVVPPPVMTALDTYYKNYVPVANIFFKKDIAAEHAMPTDSLGSACGFKGDPFINNCSFDAAGELLKWIYGNLNARQPGALSGKFIEFDQSEFLANPTAHGMSKSGWVYVPASCQQTATCRLHIVFHGCKQYPGAPHAAGPQGKFGDTFVKGAGYNAWADTNELVILYPQANAMTSNTRLPRSNPNGCWDWWGYDDGAYAKKTGRQMAAVKGMVDRLAGTSPPPPPPPPPPSVFCGIATNSAHAGAGRAYSWFAWWYFARGSNNFLGMGATQSTLKETSPGSFTPVTSCS
jgi:poly(3-hydroxybutyrate) depolymerase